MTTTVNISLPKAMYADARRMAGERKYTSISEFIRDALRRMLYPQLTENGFTPEMEQEILKIAAGSMDNDIVWDGKTDPIEFALKYQPKNGSSIRNRKLSNWVKKAS